MEAGGAELPGVRLRKGNSEAAAEAGAGAGEERGGQTPAAERPARQGRQRREAERRVAESGGASQNRQGGGKKNYDMEHRPRMFITERV